MLNIVIELTLSQTLIKLHLQGVYFLNGMTQVAVYKGCLPGLAPSYSKLYGLTVLVMITCDKYTEPFARISEGILAGN